MVDWFSLKIYCLKWGLHAMHWCPTGGGRRRGCDLSYWRWTISTHTCGQCYLVVTCSNPWKSVQVKCSMPFISKWSISSWFWYYVVEISSIIIQCIMLMQADIILLPISICHFDLPQQWSKWGTVTARTKEWWRMLMTQFLIAPSTDNKGHNCR